MLLFILLLLATIGSVIASFIYSRDEYLDESISKPVFSLFSSIVLAILLFGHTFSFCTKKYSYDLFVAEREAFKETLNRSRESGNTQETVAIVSDVSKWNVRLARYQYKATHVFQSQYVDKRMLDLKPIQ